MHEPLDALPKVCFIGLIQMQSAYFEQTQSVSRKHKVQLGQKSAMVLRMRRKIIIFCL